MAYSDTLFQASFRGIPFISVETDNEHGRRLAIHKYPNRDDVWPEDMGRKPDEFSVQGYVLGDDAILQRDLMVAVCKMAGDGVLVHPTYGILNVVLLNLHTKDNLAQRKIELHFRFIESGKKLFPGLLISTLNSILDSIGNVNTAAATNFINQASGYIAQGAQVVLKGVTTVLTFTALGGGLVKTATNLFSSASSLSGAFGRFFGGSTGSGTGSIEGAALPLAAISAGLQNLITQSSTSQAAVTVSGAALATTIQTGTAPQIATAMQNYTSSILAAVPDPAAAISIFTQMAAFPQATTLSVSAIGMSQNGLQNAITDIARRAAIAALAQAASLYQPSSYNDAQNLRNTVCTIIDSEILIAGDAGEDDVYLSLKELRAAVVQDLISRGATLAPVVTQSFGDSLPALAVSYRLYQDISRTDQVIAFANPIHPAFMPPSFSVLAQ